MKKPRDPNEPLVLYIGYSAIRGAIKIGSTFLRRIDQRFDDIEKRHGHFEELFICRIASRAVERRHLHARLKQFLYRPDDPQWGGRREWYVPSASFARRVVELLKTVPKEALG